MDNRIKDVSILANDSYSDIKEIKDIEHYEKLNNKGYQITSITNSISGFQGKVYRNEETKEIVIAYAGTDSPIDMVNDGTMIVGFKPAQLKDAQTLYNNIISDSSNEGYKITLTGHSLGGMLATQVKLDLIKDALDGKPATKENFLAIKDKLPDVTVFETPAIILKNGNSINNDMWIQNKDLLKPFGYKLNKESGLIYLPDENSLDLNNLGIEVYQNAFSPLTQDTGLAIGKVNLININHCESNDFYTNVISSHSMKNLIMDLNSQEVDITENYQNELAKQYQFSLFDKVFDTIEKLSTVISDTITKVNSIKKDPFIIDTNGDGINLGNKIYYNIDDSGFDKSIKWTQKGTDDAFLVYDKNGNQQIDGISEMFGNQTKGFEELKGLDSNKDNILDNRDKDFNNLSLWIDSNANGQTDEGEIKSLEEVGIKSFNLKSFKKDNLSDGQQNTIVGKLDVNYTDGHSQKIYEYNLKIDRRDSKYEKIEISDEIKETIPYITGIGNVADTWTSAQKDEQLKNMFQEMINSKDYSNWNSLAEEILFRWTGVDNLDLSKLSSKEQIKMKKQYALEHLNGNPSKSELSYIPNFKNEANISFETLKGNLQLNVFANSETGNELLKATLNDIDSNNNSLENVRKIIDNIGLTSKEQEREVINLYTNLLHFNGLDKEIYSRNSEILKNFSNYYEYSGVGLIEAWNNNTFDKSFFKKTETHPIYEQGVNNQGFEYQGKQIIDSGFYSVPEGFLNNLTGYNNDDIFISSSQNETIKGNYGSDTYYWGIHKGNDLIDIKASNNSSSTPPTTEQKNALDTIKFDFTINPEDIEIYQQEHGSCNLIFRNKNTNETLSIKAFGTLKPNHDQKLQCKFADGTVWSEEYIKTRAIIINNTKNYYSPYDNNENRNFVYVGNILDVKSVNSSNEIENILSKEIQNLPSNQENLYNLYQNTSYYHTDLKI